jgi:hypothetical protein
MDLGPPPVAALFQDYGYGVGLDFVDLFEAVGHGSLLCKLAARRDRPFVKRGPDGRPASPRVNGGGAPDRVDFAWSLVHATS